MIKKYGYRPLPTISDGKLYPLVNITIGEAYKSLAYVDTGASLPTLPFNAARLLASNSIVLPDHGTSHVSTGGGQIAYMRTKVPSLKIRGLGEWADVDVLVAASEEQNLPFALLGGPILDEYWVTFCGKNRQVTFEK